jgi:hypothetical protein
LLAKYAELSGGDPFGKEVS